MTTVVKDHIAIGPRPSQTYQIANTQLPSKLPFGHRILIHTFIDRLILCVYINTREA